MVPVSRSGCTDTGKCSIAICRERATGAVDTALMTVPPFGASILKETPTFPLGFRTLEVELRDHKVLLRSAAMANDIPPRVPTLVFAHTICRGNEHYVFHGARAQERFQRE